VLAANGGKPGLVLFKKEKPETILVDMKMPDIDGIDLEVNTRDVDEIRTVVAL